MIHRVMTIVCDVPGCGYSRQFDNPPFNFQPNRKLVGDEHWAEWMGRERADGSRPLYTVCPLHVNDANIVDRIEGPR